MSLNILLTRSHNYFTLFIDTVRAGETSCGAGTPKVTSVSQPVFGTNLGSFVSCRGESLLLVGHLLRGSNANFPQ